MSRHFMQISHIRRVHACSAVTCHLHIRQNDRYFLRATAHTVNSLKEIKSFSAKNNLPSRSKGSIGKVGVGNTQTKGEHKCTEKEPENHYFF